MAAFQELAWGDAFRHLRGRRRDAAAFTWYSPNGRNGFRLDQAFVSRALLPDLLRVEHVWAEGRASGVSDHAALLLDFR